jgi:hypothetical protein
MVEFTLTVPVIILLLVSVVAFAWLLFFFVTLNSAAREGTRYMIGHPQATADEITTYVKSKGVFMNPTLMQIQVDPNDPAARVRETQVTVSIRYPFQFMNTTVPYIFRPGGFQMFPPVWFEVVSTMNMD